MTSANTSKSHPNTQTTIHVVLDRSGSMGRIKSAVINGFNALVAEQAAIPGARFSLTQFDTESIDHLYVDAPIEEVVPLDFFNYVPRGGTPLYDAVGQGINALRAKKPKGRVVFAIITDGEENSSVEFTREQVLAMVTEQRKAGWEFTFMGADVDAYAMGAQLGIAPQAVYAFSANPQSAARAFASMSSSTTAYRSGATPSMVMNHDNEDSAPLAVHTLGKL